MECFKAFNPLCKRYPTYRLQPVVVEWFKKSSEQGHSDSPYYLAEMYENGTGTALDLEKALYWYEQTKKSYPLMVEEEISRVKALLKQKRDL